MNDTTVTAVETEAAGMIEATETARPPVNRPEVTALLNPLYGT